jgi:thiamine-phosphate pyrophosphorylase
VAPPLFSLLLITDEAACRAAGRDVLETLDRALPADASRVAVLLRHKAALSEEVARTATLLSPLVRERGARLFVHTHLEVARESGADGLHLADGVAPPGEPGALLLGASRHAGAALDDDDVGPFDYVMLAPIFTPTSKPADRRAPLGIESLARASERSVRPVVALGGITPDNAAACLDAGAAAVAVLGGVMSARDPGAMTAALLESLDPTSP